MGEEGEEKKKDGQSPRRKGGTLLPV